jgi:hypothetical protein
MDAHLARMPRRQRQRHIGRHLTIPFYQNLWNTFASFNTDRTLIPCISEPSVVKLSPVFR